MKRRVVVAFLIAIAAIGLREQTRYVFDLVQHGRDLAMQAAWGSWDLVCQAPLFSIGCWAPLDSPFAVAPLVRLRDRSLLVEAVLSVAASWIVVLPILLAAPHQHPSQPWGFTTVRIRNSGASAFAVTSGLAVTLPLAARLGDRMADVIARRRRVKDRRGDQP